MNLEEIPEAGNVAIIISASDLKDIFDKEDSKTQGRNKNTERMNFREALNFINEELGFKYSESSLYKNAMDNSVPVGRFGRQLVFSKDDLIKWAEKKLKLPSGTNN